VGPDGEVSNQADAGKGCGLALSGQKWRIEMKLKRYTVLDQANELVENHLALIDELFLTKKLLMDSRSRFLCRCGSCRHHTERTLAWLERFRAAPVSPPAKPLAIRTRIFSNARATDL
jgi:hypothetical protein